MKTNKKEPGIYIYSPKNNSSSLKLFYLTQQSEYKEGAFTYYILEDFDKVRKISGVYTKDKITKLPVACCGIHSPRYLDCVLVEATDIIPTVEEAKTKYPEHYI